MKRSGGSPWPDWRHKQRTHGALSGVATNSDSLKHNSNQGQRTLVFHDTTWESYLRQLHSSTGTTSEVYLHSTPDFWSSIPTPGVCLAPSFLLMEQIETMKCRICRQYIDSVGSWGTGRGGEGFGRPGRQNLSRSKKKKNTLYDAIIYLKHFANFKLLRQIRENSIYMMIT